MWGSYVPLHVIKDIIIIMWSSGCMLKKLVKLSVASHKVALVEAFLHV